ncbi:MAG: hypothetical protein WDO74_22655 [Pseudomonadota bacterium]
MIAAQRLLLVGLGDRSQFTPELMTRVGAIGMRAALELGVDSYAHASDLKDAGIDSPTRLVAQNVLRGALKAWHTQQYLETKSDGAAPIATKRHSAGRAQLLRRDASGGARAVGRCPSARYWQVSSVLPSVVS